MADAAKTSLFALCVSDVRKSHPNASQSEILKLASEREAIIKGAMGTDYEAKLKAENEKKIKEEQRAAEAAKEAKREKEW